jgi:WD40 repeat protein
MRESSLWLKAFAGLACASGLTLAVGWWGNLVDESNPVRIATLHAAPAPKEEPEKMVVWSIPTFEYASTGKGIWSPDGKSILTEGAVLDPQNESSTGEIREWDAKTGKLLRRYRGTAQGYGSSGYANSLAISPDNKWVAGVGRITNPLNKQVDNFIEIWKRDEENPSFKYADFRTQIALTFSHDSKVLLAKDFLGEVCSWNMETRKLLYRESTINEKHIADLVMHPASVDVATFAGCYWINTKTGKLLKFLPSTVAFESTCCAFDSTGKRLAVAGLDSDSSGNLPLAVMDIDISKDKVVSTSNPRSATAKIRRFSCIKHLAYSPDNKLIATACDDGTVRLVDPANAEQLAIAKEHIEKVTSVAFSPNSKYLFSVSRGTLKMWNVAALLKSKSIPADNTPDPPRPILLPGGVPAK